ncbi:SDR family NAD(P)-dependent oxidoreductase [Aquamicrobium sp. LC103]|uniref:SDR family NAD(P)-dependent oxidoreductase n=1 Tax=Aquamicrobium sp. LC103 TaxID=1120658 RepID=UPI00063EB07D|nr:SDR family NAD(P)-dependent oxidoreductase [Aquamicrobium sp. LC103]TKT76709.1 SDR family NAD(P)-dependent oxidoreductase [Aquamicrobium sp. LC103]
MTLYRADPKDGAAWITGASTGLGRQLALDLAREGYVVAATARDEDKLATLAAEASGLPGRIVPFICDVTAEEEMERTVAAIEGAIGPIALAVFNAGIYSATRGERLETYNFVSTFNVNFFGVINGLVPVADRMRDRGFGHVAIVASVTAYLGLPSAGAYGSSKAALNNMAQSLRYDFDKLNIRLQIVNPGFINTPLTANSKFPMPALMPVEKASRRLTQGLRSGGFEVAFPRRLTWATKALSLLPQSLTYHLIRKATGWDKRLYGRKRRR